MLTERVSMEFGQMNMKEKVFVCIDTKGMDEYVHENSWFYMCYDWMLDRF